MMQFLLKQYPGMNIVETATALDCSRTGYHSHVRKPRRKRRSQNAALASRIRSAFLAARGVYGCVRIMRSLRAQGLRLGKNRISKLMQANGLRVQQKRRFIPRTTIADKASPIAPNHLLARPAAERLNQVWVSDITYIQTAEGWLFLAAEMDAFSRRIIGWSTLDSLDTALPIAALERAFQTRSHAAFADLLHHSDRGCQLTHFVRPSGSLRLSVSASLRLTSSDFRRRLELCSITQSMSRKANCYDNAAMEPTEGRSPAAGCPEGERSEAILLGHPQSRVLRLLHPAHPRHRPFHDF